MMSAGVLISVSSFVQKAKPQIISTAQITALEISVVYTAVFISLIFFAPNSWEVTTEHPMLHPNAIAIKISVTS